MGSPVRRWVASVARTRAVGDTAEVVRMEIRELSGIAELMRACALFDGVWRPAPESRAMTVDMLAALTLAGSYAAGAWDGDELLGASVGFFGAPASRSLHSHVTGVSARARGLGVGFALKRHQRGWALDRGVTHVTWTFDPLVRRNAHVNLVKLAAAAVTYLPDLYGPLDDGINAGDPSDRLLVSWDLASARVAAAVEGMPAAPDAGLAGAVAVLAADDAGRPVRADPGGAATVLVDVPADVEALRRADPALASAWRAAVREVLGGLLGAGARVVGFAGTGGYVVAP